MSIIREARNLVTESTVINCFKVAGFNYQGFLPNDPNKATAYEDSDEETANFNNYAVDNNDQIPGWEDSLSKGNFTEYASCDVKLSTCDSEQKENEESESNEDDKETDIELNKVTFQKTVYSLNTSKNWLMMMFLWREKISTKNFGKPKQSTNQGFLSKVPISMYVLSFKKK